VRMIDALQKAGHEVTLYTIEKTNWAPIESDWGIGRRPHEFWYLKDQRYLHLHLVRWPIFIILYLTLLVKAAGKKDYVSLNNFGRFFPSSRTSVTYTPYPYPNPSTRTPTASPYGAP